MTMKKYKTLSLALYSAACIFIGGCSSFSTASGGGNSITKTDNLTILTIGTADSGGTMYPVGKAIAQVISDSDKNMSVNISASNGSSANVKALEKGEIDLGLVSGDVAFAACNGIDEFADTPVEGLRVIAAVYPSLSNWMAPTSLGITYVHDLIGRNIGIGPQDSTTELSARIVLDTMDLNSENTTLVNCGLGSGAEKLKDGTLDAIHGFTGIPITSLTDLANEMPVTLLQYTQNELQSIVRENSFYYMDVIPAGTYKGQDSDVNTFGIKCLLCVGDSMDEDLAYELTKILNENTDALMEMHGSLSSMTHKGFSCDDLPIMLHPGAERYYKEHELLE